MIKRIYLYFEKKYEETTVNKWLRHFVFIGLGLSATLWFLIRVIPKPSRATYPCMQTAAPLMSTFVIYLLSLGGSIAAFKGTKRLFIQRKFGWVALSIMIGLACAALFTVNNAKEVYARAADVELKFMLPANTPQGMARGIFPGRVAWSYAPGTATWDEQTGYWFEDRWNNQANSDLLMQQSILSLTGKNSEKEAWNALFSYFNQTKKRGNSGYKTGEKIAIKINQNNTYSHDDSEELNASPHLTLSLLRSLVNEGGIPQDAITVLDPSRYMTHTIYTKCAAEFPNVRYVDNSGEEGRIKSIYVADAIPYTVDNGQLATGLETSFRDADYVINFAILKGHGGQGVTLCGKNWYGATSIHSNWRKNAHNNFNQNREGKAQYMTFVDFMGHEYLGDKTMLYLIDGLYGSEKVDGKPSGKWKLAPFNGNWPNSLFASQDPVAIDAVGLDFLSSEWPGMVDINYADMYMVEAALASNPPSGTSYDPERNGNPLKSLGVVEHWNNATDKQYNRNLGKKDGIELVYKKVN
ncbi:DUF362 domain-containing protein [Parabacteroides sp. PF5-9]|uniref:DUF362 domain-containing protein n=1 Tax=Parabacteroides sp. PF5-9 TaxID=1742404 RepID=UPI002475A37F|nr:DUF362 domain-containing protein [Parabacteroides sp. PF5-9]MDH6356580.1 hypothetical protein [Parabacteroides sp. PF5-9]